MILWWVQAPGSKACLNEAVSVDDDDNDDDYNDVDVATWHERNLLLLNPSASTSFLCFVRVTCTSS